MEIALNVSDKMIANLLCCGFEGGVGYWCRIMDERMPPAPRSVLDEGKKNARVYPHIDYPLTGGAVICRLYEEETDEEYKPLVLDGAAIKRGLLVMAEKNPRHFGDFLAGREDSTTGDVFIQCCLLGSVIYG